MNNDLDTDRVDILERFERISNAMRQSGVSFREFTDGLDAMIYAFQSLNYDRYDFTEEECSPELDEFLSGFKVTTE